MKSIITVYLAELLTQMESELQSPQDKWVGLIQENMEPYKEGVKIAKKSSSAFRAALVNSSS